METPIFVSVDPEAILKEIIASYESLSGTTCQPSQPEYLIATNLAYHKALVLNRINEACKSQLLDLSNAPVTDYLAALLGVTRLPASSAVCTCRFNLVEGHLQVLLPAGTRVSSTDGNVIFETINDITIPEGTNAVDMSMICQSEGMIGNGYSIGSISVLQDPYAFVSSVSNIDISYGGAETESDQELIARVKLAPSRFSVAGSKNAYIYWAKTASSSIIDVKVLTYSEDNTIDPGEVDIYPLISSSSSDQEAINDLVENVLSSENIRPLTDIVVIKTPVKIEYSIQIDIIQNKDATSTLIATIYNALKKYTDDQALGLGLDIIGSKLEALSLVTGVYDADATIASTLGTIENNNLIVLDSQYAVCTGITINITGTR